MNFPKIEGKEYKERVNTLRKEMAVRGVDLSIKIKVETPRKSLQKIEKM